MKKRYKLDAGMDISVTVDVDLDKLQPKLAHEINAEYSSGSLLLEQSKGNIIVALVRRAATIFIFALLEGYSKEGAQASLDESDGWPPNGEHGISLINYEFPEFGPDDLEVTELTM